MVVKTIIFFLALSLQGCAVWDFIKPSKGLSVETEIVAGDKEQTVETTVTAKADTTNNTADTITQTYTTIQQGKSISDIAFMMVLSFLAGWLIMPSTRQMWLMIKKTR